MAYDVKYRCIHKEKTGGSSGITTEWYIELLKDGYTGAVTELKGSADVGGLSFPRIDPNKLFDQPIQKGIARFDMMISPKFSYDGETILDEIFAGDEATFLMRIRASVDGGAFQTLFTGFVMNDLNETTDGEYNYTSTIYAKDLDRTKGLTWTITDDRVTVLQTIADLLDELGLGLDIYTYTSYITSETVDTNDYLAQIYNDRFALQEYARTGDEEAEAISVEKALEWVLHSHKLFLRQIDGAWRLYHISAFENPASVLEFQYDSAGTAVGSSTKDFTVSVDRVSKFILPGGRRQKTKAYKSISVNFNHRTKVSGIEFPEKVTLNSGNTSETFSQYFISSGDQVLNLEATVEAYWPTAQDGKNPYVEYQIITTGYYWDEANGEWTASITSNTLDLVPRGRTTSDGYLSLNRLSIQTDQTPADADGQIQIIFRRGDSTDGFADTTYYKNLLFNIDNPIASENSTYIKYQLTQTGNWSNTLELSDTYFGDGPIGYSRAALRYSAADADTTADIWQRRGTTTGYRNFHENGLKEVMDVQRGVRENFNGTLWGYYSALSVIEKDGKNLFFFGGDLTIGSNTWDAQLVELDIETAATDTFTDLPKFSEPGTSSGTSAGGSSGGGTGGGLTEEIADGLYFQQDNLFSEIAEGDQQTARDNIGLGSIITDVMDNHLSVQALWDDKVSRGQTLQMIAGDGVAIDDETARTLDENLSWNISAKVAGVLGISAEDIVLNFSDPLYNNGGNLDIYDHGSGQPGIVNTGAQTFYGAKTFDAAALFSNNVTITGDLIVNGTQVIQNVETVEVEDNIMLLNKGESGSGVTAGSSGMRVDRGTASDFLFVFDEVRDRFVLGQATDETAPSIAALQVSATIQDSPDDGGIPYYNGTANRLDTSPNLTFDGDNITVTNSWGLVTDTFTSGFTGSGMQIDYVDSLWRMELDDLFIRGALFASEFIVNQISSLNGSEVLGPGRGKVESISGSAPGETVTLSDPQGGNYASVAANDIVLIQQVRPDNNQVVKRIVRKVSSVTNNDATFTSLSGAPSDAGSIAKGDLVVVIGNTTDTSRQSIIYRSATDDDGPFGQIKTGIDSWTAWTSTASIPFHYGYLDGFNLNGTALSGYGAYFEDNLYVSLGGGTAYFGKGADGAGNDGLYFDANNYWTTDGFKAQILGDDLETAVQELRSDLIDIYLSNDGAYSGIQFLAGQLTLTVNENDKIALVRLDATGSESVISIAADQINIDGTTTFSSGYDPSTKETPLGAQEKVNTLQTDIDSILDNAVANGTTIISGGFIQTSLIDVDDLFAQTITIGPSGSISGTNWVIDEEKWVHPSLGFNVMGFESVAAYGNNNNAANLTSEWSASQNDNGTKTITIYRKMYRHKYGVSKLVFTGNAKFDPDINSGTGSGNGEILLNVSGGSSISMQIPSIIYNEVTGEVDVSGLTAGSDYEIRVQVRAEVSGGDATDSYTSYLQSNFSVDAVID